MAYPDEELPDLHLTLEDFVSRAQNALSDPETYVEQDFVRLLLSGRVTDEITSKRISVNPRHSGAEVGGYEVRRDFDSIIGVSKDLPFAVPMAVFPLHSHRDTLVEDIHLCGPQGSVSTLLIYEPTLI